MTGRYARITPAFCEELRTIVGTEFLLTDPETLRIYGADETEDLCFPPEVVVKPGTAAEVSAILKFASANRIPVTPRGGGTGLSGGALPVLGGISLSMERFTRILKIDLANLQALVEPAVTTQRFQEEVEKVGLYYPPDPSSRGTSHIGGNVAESAGGPHAVKYGVTRDYVLGLEAVLPTGEIIHTGGRVLKNASGYNLTQLLVGSEGTLAVVTRITLRLIPKPRLRKVLLAAFDSIEKATEAVSAIFQGGVTPAAIEFMEKAAVQAAETSLGRKFPNGDAEAQLLIELDGHTATVVDDEIHRVAASIEPFGPRDLILAEEPRKIEDVWALRKSVGEAVKSISPYKEEDTVVPRSELPALIRGVKEISSRYGITAICYGHAGDGNVHVNILKRGMSDEAWNRSLEAAVEEIFRLTVSLGGAISGEHGIGYSQKRYLPIALSPIEINLLKGIKNVFDPNRILNPGKIFD